tara:strand:- start:134 stop:367 length:234 start_codon:yes stop_codon:yes gene_type:complete
MAAKTFEPELLDQFEGAILWQFRRSYDKINDEIYASAKEFVEENELEPAVLDELWDKVRVDMHVVREDGNPRVAIYC